MNVINGIYKEQKSYLIVNDDRTKEFPLWKGTRQACPLSPLLFILVLEVLLKRVQSNKEITELKLNKYEYKYHTYMDDVIFIFEDPLNTLPFLLNEVNQFVELAGFRINYKKTKVICKNMTSLEERELQRIIRCEVNKVKYLGIFFTKKNIDLYKNNYERVMESIIRDIQTWNKLKFSLLGRIAMIKIIVLPRLIFLFQALPIISKISISDKWQRILVNFIWTGKKAHLN